jgi:protein gp37
MSDLFHELVPESFIEEVFLRMAASDRHTFQVLTKRPERMLEVVSNIYANGELAGTAPLANVWLGTSIENHRFVGRADDLRGTPATVRFISAEPLLGPLADSLELADIDWLIAGGESGPKHRPLKADWVRALRDICHSSEVAFFFKQWGGRTSKAGGRTLDGVTYSEMPERPMAARV